MSSAITANGGRALLWDSPSPSSSAGEELGMSSPWALITQSHCHFCTSQAHKQCRARVLVCVRACVPAYMCLCVRLRSFTLIFLHKRWEATKLLRWVLRCIVINCCNRICCSRERHQSSALYSFAYHPSAQTSLGNRRARVHRSSIQWQ